MNAVGVMAECPIAQINEDDEDTQDRGAVEVQGHLNKWTNFLHGWQKRYFVLKNGTLLYFKSQSETECGCRGAISLLKATVKVVCCATTMTPAYFCADDSLIFNRSTKSTIAVLTCR